MRMYKVGTPLIRKLGHVEYDQDVTTGRNR